MNNETLTNESAAPWYKTAIIPNALTALRLLFLPLILAALATGHKTDALIFFLVAEMTDILDGWVARRLNVASEFGAFADSMADKVFHLPLFFYFLVYPRPVLPHVFLLREILANYATYMIFGVITLIEVMLVLSRTSVLEKWRVSASNRAGFWGKLKTWIQAAAIGGFIYGTIPSVTASQILVVVAIGFGGLSLSSRIRFVRDGH